MATLKKWNGEPEVTNRLIKKWRKIVATIRHKTRTNNVAFWAAILEKSTSLEMSPEGQNDVYLEGKLRYNCAIRCLIPSLSQESTGRHEKKIKLPFRNYEHLSKIRVITHSMGLTQGWEIQNLLFQNTERNMAKIKWLNTLLCTSLLQSYSSRIRETRLLNFMYKKIRERQTMINDKAI